MRSRGGRLAILEQDYTGAFVIILIRRHDDDDKVLIKERAFVYLSPSSAHALLNKSAITTALSVTPAL